MTSFYTSTSYSAITKWSVTHSGSSLIYKCERSWTVLEVGGVSIDPDTNKMYVVQRVRLTNQYSIDLWEVSRSQPNIALQTWSLGIISPSGSQTNLNSYARPAGLDVQMPRISVNVYCYYYAYTTYCDADRVSWMNVYHQRSNWPELQGEFPSSYATMGIENIDGELATTCMYASVTSYCPSATTMRKITMRGQGSSDWMGTPTANSATITSSMQTLARSISELSIGVAITWEPTGTSVDFEVTNDGGTTWKRANSAGQTITFTNAGNSLGWRAWLNGTASAAPLLDTVGLTYAATYASSGQLRAYRYSSTSTPDAATVWWNASTPGGSSLDIYFRTSSSCTSGNRVNIPSSGSVISFSQLSMSYLSICIDMDAGTSNQYTPTLYDLNIAIYENAPQDIKIDIYDTDSTTPIGCTIPEYEWEYDGTLLGRTTAQSSSGNDLLSAFNCIVPQLGSGTEVVGVKIHSASQGKVEIKSMRIEYTMVTVNLDINYDESMVLHERGESYEIVTRHVIGDNALSITNAELTFLATPNSDAPKLSWSEDGTLVDDDPEDWIIPDQGSTWTNLSNGIFEIHWMFRVTDDFPEQNNVGWRISCTDDNGFSPTTLSTIGTSANIVVNQSYGLGWFTVHDVEGDVVNDDVQNGDWVVAGEMIHFQGQVWFEGTQDAPLNSVFDVRVARKDSQGDFVSASWKDNSNPNGTFFISIAVPDMDIPEGVTFEVQAYNVRDPTKVMPINESWQRTMRIDDSSPEITNSWPADGDYEASSPEQQVAVTIVDSVGQPDSLTLNYWVEADHDTNRNGLPDEEEYATQTMTNSTVAEEKVFFGVIDDSRNPNMARVSYFVSGHDPAGNLIIGTDGPGFSYDLSTYRTRQDMASVFTGLVWQDHDDGADVYSGTDQSISVGLVDANGIIDFEYIALIFDFEGPDPERDQQRISYNGRTDVWSSESEYITLKPSSSAMVTTNDTGLPWIQTTFDFQFSWDWPDEDISDLALEFKELGSTSPTRIEFIEHTFSVENDLVLDAATYIVEDVAEPRTGPLDDATPVRPDDRLRWSGRVVYESSDVPAPNDLGITVEVFDGVQYWSDGSLTDDGAFSIEVPLTAATTLQSAETRTFLTGVRNVPGRGEDMTRDTVATTLQLQVDHTPPRIHHRLAPVNVIDISASSDLTSLPVRFSGWEECVLVDDDDRCAAFSQSPQWVNWVMRDDARTIAAGISPLAMQLNETHLEWIGEVDLTSNGLVTPRSGYKIGFWVTGHDAAGNEFPMAANTESDPVREREDLDSDQNLAWVRLGATVAELIVKSVTLEQDILSEGTEIEITTIIANTGGVTESSFSVQFVTDEKVIDTVRITGLPSGGEHRIISTWTATKGIDRITVIVDSENEIIEVDEEGNSMSAGVSVEYSWGLGWVDSWRQNPLTVIGVIFALILIPVIATITWKTSLSGSTSLYDDELLYEDEEEDEWEDDDDEDGWE
ncbi:MAG: CARDB domain-containing protein [Candidatus Thalassarchaeaceae archaeon]|nr:CARDB domain-containing protein [Candidatus Thalassarchaeaceae archaeon]